MAAEMEVPITFASDAHAPNEVGPTSSRRCSGAQRRLHHYCRFTQRQREMVKL